MITAHNDCKEKHQSFSIDIDNYSNEYNYNSTYGLRSYGCDTSQSIDNAIICIDEMIASLQTTRQELVTRL